MSTDRAEGPQSRRWSPSFVARPDSQRVRLGILAIAHEARRVEFSFLRNTLELSAGNLSQHLTVLENAGLITMEKGYEGRHGRTWVQLTKTGRRALNEEIAALKTLIHLKLNTTEPESQSLGGLVSQEQAAPRKPPSRLSGTGQMSFEPLAGSARRVLGSFLSISCRDAVDTGRRRYDHHEGLPGRWSRDPHSPRSPRGTSHTSKTG